MSRDARRLRAIADRIDDDPATWMRDLADDRDRRKVTELSMKVEELRAENERLRREVCQVGRMRWAEAAARADRERAVEGAYAEGRAAALADLDAFQQVARHSDALGLKQAELRRLLPAEVRERIAGD